MLIAGDIGGTKTILGIYSREAGPFAPLQEATFSSRRYGGFAELIAEFLGRAGVKAGHAVLAVAGRVVDQKASITNLPWTIRAAELARTLNLRSILLLNDVEAVAAALPLLRGEDLLIIQKGEADPGGTRAVVAPGTGLGEAFLTREDGGFRARASEGGHADFAPAGDQQIGLLKYLHPRYGHVSWERVCSGNGIPAIYDYLKEAGCAAESPRLAEQFARSDDRTPLIVEAALAPAGPCPLCRGTLEMFVSILGAEAGNLALKVLATGGVYLGGGIPPRLAGLLGEGPFIEAFLSKGRFSRFMERIPVHVILNPKAALLGAAARGLNELERGF